MLKAGELAGVSTVILQVNMRTALKLKALRLAQIGNYISAEDACDQVIKSLP